MYRIKCLNMPGFANHDLKTGPFYHDLMMLTNMYIFPLKAFAILFSEHVIYMRSVIQYKFITAVNAGY